MKIFLLNLVFLALVAFGVEGRSQRGHEHGGDNEEHEEREECEKHEEFQYKCNNNVWVNYMLDAQPAEDGVFYGDLEPGVPTFVGYGEISSVILPGRIEITGSKGLTHFLAQRTLFRNDTSEIFYLLRDCHHNYTWEASSGTTVVPFAIEPKEPNVNGFPTYIARKIIDGKLYFGFVGLPGGYMIYYDSLGKSRRATEYEVLTCRSKHFEEAPPPTPTTVAPSSGPNTGCVHNWQPYTGDDAPSRNGIAAGLYDVDNTAYVGKGFDGTIWNFGRVQVSQPDNGVNVIEGAKLVNHKNDGYYLVDNPNYHYYWIDSPARISSVANAVTIRVVDGSAINVNVGRLQIDGQVYVGTANEVGLGFVDQEAVIYAQSFQILVCDPKPANPCKQEWKPYHNDDAPANDGFRVDYYKDGIVSYVGRSDNKRVFGHDFVVGRVQTSPSNDSGVYTLQSVNGGEKFDPHHGEYLVKNSGDLYEWVNAHTGQEVENALKVPITHASDCCHDGHHKESAYIGRFYLDNVVNIGTVYQRQGLAFVDVNGDKKVVSSFQVLTCASPVKPCEVEEDDHHDCDCDHQCLDEEKFYYL